MTEGRDFPALSSGGGNFTRRFYNMQQMRDICDTVFENGAAVLMARIIDDAGVCVRRSQVAAIGYSIYELDRFDPQKLSVVAGHDRVLLDVDEVLLDALEAGGEWSVDVAGYNFRHEIHANDKGLLPKQGAQYEIRYLFMTKFGEQALVRFYARFISK